MAICKHFRKELSKVSGKSPAETSSVICSGDPQRSWLVPESGIEIYSYNPGKVQIWFLMWSVLRHEQGDSLPSPRLPSRPCWPTCHHPYSHLGSGQQGPSSCNPECLHFREVFKAEWKTRQGEWWCDGTQVSFLNPRTVSWLQLGLPFVLLRLFPKLLLKQNTS